MTIIAAADGSALGNPGPAGWAWYVDESCWAAGGWCESTNNRGELTAVLELLRATEAAGLAGEELLIQADSQYVINSLTKWRHGWKKRGWRKGDGKPVLNVDLMQALDAALAGRLVRFEWVKGHAGHPANERADDLARAAATAYQRGTPVPSGPGWPGVPGTAGTAGGSTQAEVAEADAAAAAGPATSPSGRGGSRATSEVTGRAGASDAVVPGATAARRAALRAAQAEQAQAAQDEATLF